MPSRKPLHDPFADFDLDEPLRASDHAKGASSHSDFSSDFDDDTFDYSSGAKNKTQNDQDPFDDMEPIAPQATSKKYPSGKQENLVKQEAFSSPPKQKQDAKAFVSKDQGTLNATNDHDDHEDEEEVVVISIPRINVHFFAETSAVGKACEACAADRRMSRATCLVRGGGFGAAIEAYQSEPTPSLLIVETQLKGRALLAALPNLAEVCETSTKVIIIGAHNDIVLYRELMRLGISDYVVAPISPLKLLKTIAQQFNDPDTPFVGRSIAVVGARGGAGSSTIAHNIAYMVSESQKTNTVIVDYDLPFGTTGLDFNQDPLHGLADALNSPERLDATLLDRMLTKCTERLSIFSSPASLDQDFTTDPDIFDLVTLKVRSVAPIVVMDLPHLWSEWLKRNLIAADDVIIVATPDLASLRNAKNIIDLLKNHRPNDKAPRIVLNQVDTPGKPEISLKDFTAAIGIAPCAQIPFDAKSFGQAANNGQMILQCAKESKAAAALNGLVGHITGRSVEPEVKKSFLAKILKK